MTKLFTASTPAFTFSFNTIDELTDYIDQSNEVGADYIDPEWVEIVLNDVEIEKGGVLDFINKFDVITYDLLVDIDNGDYDEFFETDGDNYYQFKYLTDYNGQNAEEALENCNEVYIFEGSALEFVEQNTIELYGEVPKHLERYIDWGSMADQFKNDGDLFELEYGVWVTNSSQI